MSFKTNYRSGEQEAEIMQTCWAYGIKIVRYALDNTSVVLRVIKNINNQEYVTTGKVIYSQKTQAKQLTQKMQDMYLHYYQEIFKNYPVEEIETKVKNLKI